MIRDKLRSWFRSHGRDLPWRRDPTPYAVMVSELMLQQTQVATVIPYFEKWMARFPSVESLAQAAEADVLHHWQGLGYYSRARNLHRAAQVLLERFGGRIPEDPALLLTLPGIGRYTAGAIASFAFNHPVAAVDANIARVLARLCHITQPIDSTEGNAALWDAAERLLPAQGHGREHNSALMELGALRCSPKRPQCLACPIQKHCSAPDPESLPLKKPRQKTVSITENAAWILQNEAVLLEQQTGRRAGGLWKLPVLEQPPLSDPLLESVYPFTHHRVTLRVFEVPPSNPIGPSQRWFSTEHVLSHAALTAPHRRALESLLQTVI